MKNMLNFALVFLLQIELALAFDCPKVRPSEDDILLFANCEDVKKGKDSVYKKWPDYADGPLLIDKFKTDEICACYGYKGAKVGRTAINITSVRYFEKANKNLLKNTTLYRNAVFYNSKGKLAKEPIGKIDNVKYDEYHSEKKVLET